MTDYAQSYSNGGYQGVYPNRGLSAWLRNRRSARPSATDQQPLMDMNTTPLIDVMLVLLVMLIITIPPQTHAVKVDVPAGPSGLVFDRVKNEVALTAQGQAYWNGVAVDDTALRQALATSAAMAPQPELHFRPDAATRYARVDTVMAMVRQAGVGGFGFVGNERYRDGF